MLLPIHIPWYAHVLIIWILFNMAFLAWKLKRD